MMIRRPGCDERHLLDYYETAQAVLFGGDIDTEPRCNLPGYYGHSERGQAFRIIIVTGYGYNDLGRARLKIVRQRLRRTER